jgi:N-methylhydantoinase A
MLLGVDIGGTYTDLALMDPITGKLTVAKVPTTTADESTGLLNGLDDLGIEAGAIDLLIHGTTVATNALIERKGAVCGLITSKGFRDTLELRRRDRPNTYGLGGKFKPLIERRFRFEVDERMSAQGEVIQPLNVDQVLTAGKKILDAGAEVVIVSFLHSYVNRAHEQMAAEALRSIWPNDFIVIGSDIYPAVREFERTSTAVISGYIQPVISHYLNDLTRKLRDRGFRRELLVVQSNGGLMSAPLSIRFAANTILSGPAGGVTGSMAIASDLGFESIVSCDMGGTSFDVCVIRGGRPAMSQQKSIDFGLPLCLPMLDVDALAAGGGSLARLDASGILTIGPESAGAVPGPVCYGRGGTIPTVTDASVVVGILDASRAIGKSHGVAMDAEAARVAIKKHIADPLKLSVDDAAEAILTVAGHTMAGYLRRRLTEKGLDPRGFSLIAFGGAGPVHCNRLLREVGLERAVVPLYPGITSAIGCMLGQLKHDFMRSVNMPLSKFRPSALEDILKAQEEEGRELLKAEGVPSNAVATHLSADMCYRGQTHLISVDLPRDVALTPQTLRAAFEKAYQVRYSQLLSEVDIVVVNARTQVADAAPKAKLANVAKLPTGPIPAPKSKKVFLLGRWIDCAVYDRMELPVDCTIEGPAVLLQLDTTTFVEPGFVATVHATGNILIEAKK